MDCRHTTLASNRFIYICIKTRADYRRKDIPLREWLGLWRYQVRIGLPLDQGYRRDLICLNPDWKHGLAYANFIFRVKVRLGLMPDPEKRQLKFDIGMLENDIANLQSLLANREATETPPWQISPLDEWAICGMNHYHVGGERMLFVSMTKDGRCITSEGKDNWVVWNNLMLQAAACTPLPTEGGQ